MAQRARRGKLPSLLLSVKQLLRLLPARLAADFSSCQDKKEKEDGMAKHIVIIPGDDAAPEAMIPAVEILKSLSLDVTFTEFPSGEEGVQKYGSRGAFDQALRAAIDQSDTTLFGSTNGTTGGMSHLRWGKSTFANVRPARWRPG